MHDVSPLMRQWKLLTELSSSRYGATVAELAELAKVSLKTIRRDLKALQQAGFPIEESTVERGLKRWKISQPSGSPILAFTFTEALSLYLGRSFLQPLAGTYFWDGAQTAYRKVRAQLTESALAYLDKISHAIVRENSGVGDYSRHGQLIDTLMVAIEDHKFADITYHSMQSTEPVSQMVYPYGLVYFRGSLYLVAYAPHHEEIRHYKIDRVHDVDVTDLRFEKPRDFDLQTHMQSTFGIRRGDGRPVRVRVHFRPPASRFVQEYRWHETQQFEPQADGSVIVSFELDEFEDVKQWVLGFGSGAVVLEPESLRESLRSELDATLQLYSRESRGRELAKHSRKETLK